MCKQSFPHFFWNELWKFRYADEFLSLLKKTITLEKESLLMVVISHRVAILSIRVYIMYEGHRKTVHIVFLNVCLFFLLSPEDFLFDFLPFSFCKHLKTNKQTNKGRRHHRNYGLKNERVFYRVSSLGDFWMSILL